MSRQYHRRYYRRRSRSSSEGLVGFVVILALLAYSYSSTISLALTLTTILGLAIAGLLVFYKVGAKLWRWRRSKHSKITISYSLPDVEADIDTMTGLEFERYVAELLKQRGFTNVRLTEIYDLGVDIIAHKGDVVWGVQVKRSNGMVKAIAVRQVVTALRHYKCDRAMRAITAESGIVF